MLKTINILMMAIVFLFVSACNYNTSESADDESSTQNQAELAKAPDFEVTTINGQKVSLKRSMDENKPLVIYFTASWCPVCAKNWPALSEVYPEYKDKLNLVVISIDPTDDEKVMRKLSKEKGFTFPVTAGNPKVMMAFGVESQATTVGVNRDGYIEFQKSKTTLTADEYRALFDELVN